MLVIALPARFPLRFLIALALGALHAASFIDDATWPIELAALAGLVALSTRAARDAATARGAAWFGARVGFAFGLGWFLVGVSWIYISLHTYGEMNPLIAGAATFALCAYLSVYPALACAGFAWFRTARAARASSDISSVLVFAALWVAGEFGRVYVFTGFPWLASGYAHVGGPLAGYAPIVGVYGVSLVAAAIAAVIALTASAARRRSNDGRTRSRMLLLVVVVFVLPFVGHLLTRIDWTHASGAPIRVRLLQGNVAQDIKFVPGHFDRIVDDYLAAIDQGTTGAGRADLIVLPETAFPVFLQDLPEDVGRRLARAARVSKVDIAFGIPIQESEDRYFNSVIAIGPSSDASKDAKTDATPDDPLAGLRAQRYDKSHLVPFGEFIPTGFHWFVRLMNMPLGDFTRGATDQKPMTLAGNRVAFNICYEDLFGAEIIRQAGDANILVNVSNVAWFGDSMALPQHLDISRMRSIETGRPMLRATNTGMTASIDPHGRVLAKLAPFTAGALDVPVQGMTGETPYIRAGNVPVYVLIVLMLIAALSLTRRSADPTAQQVRTRPL